MRQERRMLTDETLVDLHWDNVPQQDNNGRGKCQHAYEAHDERSNQLSSCTKGFWICPSMRFDLSTRSAVRKYSIRTLVKSYVVKPSRDAVKRTEAVRVKDYFRVDDAQRPHVHDPYIWQ